MDADEFKVTDILSRNERFVVPLYQRQYQWHDCRDGNRTSAFWQDVASKAGDVLDGRARFEHYMGALLLAPGATQRAFGMTPIAQVVDGQQRLTTFLILLSAIREIATEKNFEDIAEECKKYLFNEPGKSDTDEFVRFKLTPTPVDREVFFNILDQPLKQVRSKYRAKGAYWGSGVPMNTGFRALRSYEFFIAQVMDFIVRVRPGTLCRITEFSEHESNGRELDEGERVAVEVLPVLGQSAAAVEPGDGAFDHPTPGLDDEALHPIGSLDDLGLEIGQDAGQGAVKDRALIGAVGEQFPEKGKQTEQGRQQRETAVAILNVGGGDDAVQQQALRIDQNMPLLALDQLAGIEAVAVDASPPFSALFTL